MLNKRIGHTIQETARELLVKLGIGIITLLAVWLINPQLSCAGVNEWVTNGPSGAIVYSLSISPGYASDKTVLAGTDRGVYKTTDGGQSWSQVGLSGSYVLSIAVSPDYTNDHTVFAGTSTSGVYKSIDSGANWSQSGLSGNSVSALCISPNFLLDHAVFAGTSGYGVYKSTDAGASWSQSNSGMGNVVVSSLAISPNYTVDSMVVAGTNDGNGVYKSTEAGGNWNKVNAGITNLYIKAVAISPNYATDNTIFADAYKTTNGGANWSSVGAIGGDVYSLAISPNYATDHTLFAGTYGNSTYKSTDYGATWAQIASGLTNSYVSSLGIVPSFATDSAIFAGTWGAGVFSCLTSADSVPPVVTSTDPANGATGVANNKAITLTFNENIVAGVAYSIITVKDAANNPVTVTTNATGRTLTISKSSDWTSGTTYTVIIPANAVKDTANNNLAAQYTLSFTAKDTVAPTVSAADPASNATGVAKNKAIAITFNESIQAGTAYESITLTSGGSATTITKSISGSTLTVTPSTGLTYSKSYTLTIPAAAVKDLAGNAFAAQYTLNFTAGTDTEAPTVTSTNPANGATASKDTTTTITFSEEIQSGSAYESITLKDAAGTTIPIKKDVSGVKLTLNQTTDLASSITYTVTIPANAVKDKAGNGLAAQYTLSFTTGADSAAPVAPTGLRLVSDKDAIQLAWDTSKETDIAGYNVYRKLKGTSIYAKLTGTKITETQFQDKTAEIYRIYVYHVTAVDKAGNESQKSSEVEAAIGGTKGVFADIAANAWYKDAISKLASQDIIAGYTDGSFKPSKPVTRAQFAKMICLARKWQLEEPSEASFKDVGKNTWMFKYVETAKKQGIIDGYEDDSFKPDKSITRAEIAKIVASALKLTEGSGTLKDVDASWAKDYIKACVKAGIVGGFADGTFKPGKTATRAEASKMIVGVLDSNADSK